MKAGILIIALTLTASAYGQAYKWVDKDGKTRYGDVPPPGAQATRLKGPSPAPAPAPAAVPADAKKDDKKDKELTPEAAFRKRQQEREEAEQKSQKERADAETKRQNCSQAQTYLRTLQSGQRIVSANGAGERAYMEDEQRQRETEKAQRSVSEWCK